MLRVCRGRGSELLLRVYRTMVLIRQAEERLVKLFAEGGMPGLIHPYIGEEATAVGVWGALRADDYLTSTHRGARHIHGEAGAEAAAAETGAPRAYSPTPSPPGTRGRVAGGAAAGGGVGR